MRILQKIKNLGNQGSTMVEVLVGFTILVIIIAECMVHITGVSSEMIMKSQDLEKARLTMLSDMYKADAEFETLGHLDLDGKSDITFTISVNMEKTDTKNRAVATNFSLDHANLTRYEAESTDMYVFRVKYNK